MASGSPIPMNLAWAEHACRKLYANSRELERSKASKICAHACSTNFRARTGTIQNFKAAIDEETTWTMKHY